MTPTCKLRFINRKVPATMSGNRPSYNIKVLQQWWKFDDIEAIATGGEWRDVPLEME